MSKERLTADEMFEQYQKDAKMKTRFVNPEKNIEAMEAFARQEVEAAIAETKKQRDELLTALKALLDYPAEDLVAWAEGTEAIECTFTPYHIKQCLTAITNAQEK
jgi:hypothetical protein